MRIDILLIATVLLSTFAASDANACSPMRGYKIVKPVSYPYREDFIPPPPHVVVEKLTRGFDDGNPGSCSDGGSLMLVVDDRPHPDVIGYTFRIRSGSFPDDVFPDAVLAPVDLGHGKLGFTFWWLDWLQGQRRSVPIDVTVEVRRVAGSGKESEPLLLHILHPGAEGI